MEDMAREVEDNVLEAPNGVAERGLAVKAATVPIERVYVKREASMSDSKSGLYTKGYRRYRRQQDYVSPSKHTLLRQSRT
jgi:hypothetical protein